MSLTFFQRWWRSRKQAVKEPAPQPDSQATTEDVNLPRITPQSRTTNIKEPEIDDTAIVPANGFLNGDNRLPTYQPKRVIFQGISETSWVLLTISDVLSTIDKEADLARCILFETARLQRPLSFVGSLKLSQDARVLDMELIDLDKVLDRGRKLIERSEMEDRKDWKDQNAILEGDHFKKAIRKAKRSLLELEKTFNDQILGELKSAMQSKGGTNYEAIVGKVKNLKDEIRQVYDEITTVYAVEYSRRRYPDTQ